MAAEFRWAAIALLTLATSASAAELVFDVEEVAPSDGSVALSMRVSVVHRGRWSMRQRIQQKLDEAQRQYRRYRNMVDTIHPLFPDPLHDEWKQTRDDWMGAQTRYTALIESYGPLRWVVRSSWAFRAPGLAVLRVPETALRDQAQVAQRGDEAVVRLELFRRRWFRPALLVAVVEQPIRLLPDTGAVFRFGAPDLSVKIRTRWTHSSCITQLADREARFETF